MPRVPDLHRSFIATLATLTFCGIFSEAAAQDAQSLQQSAVGGFPEPARLVRAKGWQWDHEVRVWLPPSYKSTTKAYPTLWVVDNFLEPARAALFGAGLISTTPEMIVVAVGAPAATSIAEFQRRRTYDFIPSKALMGEAFAGLPAEAIGGAPGFLDFLVRQLRPLLAREYRMDPNDHAIAGHSGGAQFALYVLFNQPESFSKYLVSSPAASRPWLDMEESWFKEHKDLKARVFLSAGEAEANHPQWAAAQFVSTVALMSERLTSRKYLSLSLDVRIFPGEDHLTVIPVAYAHGIRYLWRK